MVSAPPAPPTFQTGFPIRPDRLVEAATPEDVREAVAYAGGRGLHVAAHASGHGLPGPVEGGVLIATRALDSVTVDPVRRTALIGAGASWGRVIEAAAPHGLAPLNGSSPSVGAVSYTLGGGLGILAREFGYAADHVRSLDVVTADGIARRVTPEREPELFWGLRGGGHRLGVVTGLEIALMAVERLYGGSIVFDGAGVAEVVRGYLAWTRTVPETLTSSLAALVYPALPQLPEELRGRYVISVRVAFTGDVEEGDRLVAPLRAIGRSAPILSDSLREMPYTESHTIHSDPPFPHAYYGDSAVLGEPDAERTVQAFELAGPRAPMMTVVQLNHLGGALAARPEVENAVPYRDAGFLLRLLSPLDGTEVGAVRALYGEVGRVLEPAVLGRSLNFSFGGGDRTAGFHEAETAKRLAGLVSQYDPAGLFGGPYGA
ncbi:MULTISPECIES: FAD-binding oxidoreductase [unclassified Streptomyces]|uniref:FAD-binding oxidoreductase n=1 Tax=unclassified Streptomyces TaxID=2593676 RepID=UPI000978E227|nr:MULTISPECIES: FAD-binding oxidoreductase [unclassified Streptomyces]ONI54010.1 Mitomycin radical oxidase [Streptomyces sp. IB2014 011-1]RDV52234.1 FAD-binding oxidoreductase [Streptomyces sp. IB2014 011-12]